MNWDRERRVSGTKAGMGAMPMGEGTGRRGQFRGESFHFAPACMLRGTSSNAFAISTLAVYTHSSPFFTEELVFSLNSCHIIMWYKTNKHSILNTKSIP